MSNEVTNMIADGCDTNLEDFAEEIKQQVERKFRIGVNLETGSFSFYPFGNQASFML